MTLFEVFELESPVVENMIRVVAKSMSDGFSK
jgi:hypothetical protein